MPCPLCYSLACNAYILSLEMMLACLVFSLYIISSLVALIDLLSSYMSLLLPYSLSMYLELVYSLLPFSTQDIAYHVLIPLLSVYHEP